MIDPAVSPLQLRIYDQIPVADVHGVNLVKPSKYAIAIHMW